MTRGRFISFEGPEGSGKTTHMQRLEDTLKKQGIQVITTREPGGTKLGEAVREILQFDKAGETPCPRTELLLFLASRAQIVDTVIEPALAAGTWVLCDRFCDSTIAYQGYGRNLGAEKVTELNSFATNGLMPDTTILLDIPPEVSAQRVADRNGATDRFEQEEISFHKTLRDGFLELATQNPTRIKVINSLQEVEEVATNILHAIDEMGSIL